MAYIVSNEVDVGALLKVVAYPTPSAPVQVSSTRVAGGHGWLSAAELYWLDLSRRMWSATVSSQGGQLDVGAPKPMFDGQPLGKDVGIVGYDMPRERFLIAIDDTAREGRAADPRERLEARGRQHAACAGVGGSWHPHALQRTAPPRGVRRAQVRSPSARRAARPACSRGWPRCGRCRHGPGPASRVRDRRPSRASKPQARPQRRPPGAGSASSFAFHGAAAAPRPGSTCSHAA